jgi:hypothetical protein
MNGNGNHAQNTTVDTLVIGAGECQAAFKVLTRFANLSFFPAGPTGLGAAKRLNQLVCTARLPRWCGYIA